MQKESVPDSSSQERSRTAPQELLSPQIIIEVADLIRSAGTAFIERNRKWIRWTHIKVLRAIVRCRTAALRLSGQPADAPPYCRYASLPWVRFLCRWNQKPPPNNRTLFGVAPSVADRWRSSNDLPQLESNSVLHYG